MTQGYVVSAAARAPLRNTLQFAKRNIDFQTADMVDEDRVFLHNWVYPVGSMCRRTAHRCTTGQAERGEHGAQRPALHAPLYKRKGGRDSTAGRSRLQYSHVCTLGSLPLRSSPEHVFGGVGAHPRWYRCTRTTLRAQLREAVCKGEDVVQVRR